MRLYESLSERRCQAYRFNWINIIIGYKNDFLGVHKRRNGQENAKRRAKTQSKPLHLDLCLCNKERNTAGLIPTDLCSNNINGNNKLYSCSSSSSLVLFLTYCVHKSISNFFIAVFNNAQLYLLTIATGWQLSHPERFQKSSELKKIILCTKYFFLGVGIAQIV
jgi:hypothetical protein